MDADRISMKSRRKQLRQLCLKLESQTWHVFFCPLICCHSRRTHASIWNPEGESVQMLHYAKQKPALWRFLSDLPFLLEREHLLRMKALSQRTHHHVSNPQRAYGPLGCLLFFLSRCDLVECTISSHNKWTKMMFHLRMCLNQNTLWLQLLPAEWAPFSICMMSRFVCTLWALFVMKYFLISYMSNRLRLIDAVAK